MKYGSLRAVNERSKLLGFVSPDLTSITETQTTTTKTVTPAKYDLYKYPRYAFIRENCLNCKIRRDHHLSDISIGDIFGEIAPEFDDGNGISLIISRTAKGRVLLDVCQNNLKLKNVTYDNAVALNPRIEQNVLPNPWRDYCEVDFESKSAQDIYYEVAILNAELTADRNLREYFKESIRGDIYSKLLKYQSFGCVLDNEPLLSGKVVVYGAGKIGKLLTTCSDNKIVCFVEGHPKVERYGKYSIYKFDDNAFKEIIESFETITFLITPVWDFEAIYNLIRHTYGNHVGIVSVENVVEKIWI
jgi:hypothetical protein